MKKIYKIVITGGPCGGKTTALKKIKEHFESKGLAVLIVPETATELIMGGVSSWSLGSQLKMQRAVLPIQLVKEDSFFEAANSVQGHDEVLVVCDRGSMDGKAYLSDGQFDKIMEKYKITEEKLLNRYDAVYHLVTAAEGAEKQYTLSNNVARTESPKEARELDLKTQQVWKKHHNFIVIDNSTCFKKKIERLILSVDKLVNNFTKK